MPKPDPNRYVRIGHSLAGLARTKIALYEFGEPTRFRQWLRQRFVEGGLERALKDGARPGAEPKLNERQCAHVIAIACSSAPEGHDHWTLRLLADKVVELGFTASFSHESVRRTLKKTTSSLGKSACGASPRSAPSM